MKFKIFHTAATKCADDNTANCRNGGICFDTDKCFCTEDYIGDKCDTALCKYINCILLKYDLMMMMMMSMIYIYIYINI